MRTLSAISLLLVVAGSAWSRAQTPVLERSEPDNQCDSLSKDKPDYVPLAKTCRFALSYRRSLPNFMCEQNMENSALPASAPPVVIHATVRYEDGRDSYSDLVVNGKPTDEQTIDSVQGISMATAGEFGSQLINLFRPPIVAAFKLRKSRTSAASSVVVYDFSVAAKDNKFWSIRDTKSLLHPEYEGQLYVDRESGYPVRILGRWRSLPKSFQLKSAEIETYFENVTVSDVGAFLLPTHSSAKACAHVRPRLPRNGEPEGDCVRNVMWFSNCHKFTSKTKIFMTAPTSP